MKKIIILLLLLSSCTFKVNDDKTLTEATYVIFYTEKNIDTLNVKTFCILHENSDNGTNEIYSTCSTSLYEIYYRNTAPFKRIYFKQTIIK